MKNRKYTINAKMELVVDARGSELKPLLESFSTAELVKVYNKMTGKELKKFSTKGEAIERCTKEAEKLTESAAPKEAAKTESKASKPHIKARPAVHKTEKEKPTKAKSKGGHTFSNELRIKLLVEDNPKRKGSSAYKMFELYRKGVTVGQYKEKGGKLNNLYWDVDHKFVAVAAH